MSDFTHLHVHTQYSILDGASNISKLIKKTKALGMDALAITDHGNMFGVKEFFDTAREHGIKPIIGCEVYVASKDRKEKTEKEDRGGYHLILLAKNMQGYKNLVKLVSLAWIEGFYYKPRIDKKILREYSEGLIACSACMGGELPKAVMRGGIDRGQEVLDEYLDIFGEDYFIELQDHGMEDQKKANQMLIELGRKNHVPLIATNDAHFLNREDAEAHDILICLSTGKDLNDEKRLRFTGEEYLKTTDEMKALFPDVPEAISNTNIISDRIEEFDLNHEILLPEFAIPEEFSNQDDYLRHLSYEGAKDRYSDITDEIKERLDYELDVIKNMGFSGYFLIVQDFINAAREMGVWVGPGRGSAAGSAVAYSIGITDLDPIKYKLLFERFLNPERVTMPDIDIDFDEDGREDVMKWVVDKYGKEKVAQIITFGTMAAKMSIKDVARVLTLPLPEANRLAKLVPDGPKVNLKKSFESVKELSDEKESGEELVVKTLTLAETLEGSVRQTGIHACGVIIGPEDLTQHIPLSINKDSDLYITQYDGKHIENVGMLKMDFLGLKTLSIIKDAVENVKISKGVEIDINKIPYDDTKTFELYQRGETVGTFQFESPGMRSHLRELKPTCLEDLFAMNALYRPGPMEFIPLFIKRKHGLEKVAYPHDMLKDILKDTYGIMVYQEQIMQTAQIMGGFSLGSADLLRRAMGKKKMDIMEQQKAVFIEGAEKKGVDPKKASEVFDIMTEFAKYGFNRSHSAAYSIVAFQTGYMKAHYPAEYMAAVLSRNLADIKKIKTFMDECKRMGLQVLGPDVNESRLKFNVNEEGNIRFGLAAVKGVGEGAVLEIIRERHENGPFSSVYDFVERVNLRTVNKKNIEALATSGAFDNLGQIERSRYFAQDAKQTPFIDSLVRYGSKIQEGNNGAQQSLFGDAEDTSISKPEVPTSEGWSSLEKLNREKELIGIYLSAHPLDDYRIEIDNFCNGNLGEIQDLHQAKGKDFKLAGIVTSVEHRMTKNNKPFGRLSLEDFTDTYTFTFFAKEYVDYSKYMKEGYALFIKGKVQTRKYNQDELEFKVNSISLLSELKENMIKSICIKIPVDRVNNEMVKELEEISRENKGNVHLKFLLFDPLEKIWVEMYSRNHQIELNDSFMDYLKKNSNIEFKIN